MKKYLPLLFLLLSACATMQTIQIESRSRVYEHNFQKALKAVVRYCSEQSFAISFIDKEIGIVNTEYKISDKLSNAFGNSMRIKLNFVLSEIGNKTKIVVNSSFEVNDGFGWSQANLSEEEAVHAYEVVLDKIERNLNEDTK